MIKRVGGYLKRQIGIFVVEAVMSTPHLGLVTFQGFVINSKRSLLAGPLVPLAL
jgi:hypothetical protein